MNLILIFQSPSVNFCPSVPLYDPDRPFRSIYTINNVKKRINKQRRKDRKT